MPSTNSTNACSSQQSALQRMFQSADKNSDGALDQSEFSAYMQSNVKKSSVGGAAGGAFTDMFKQADANGDQMIDFKEFKKLVTTSSQFAEDVTGADCQDGPASSHGSGVSGVAVTNDKGSSQGDSGSSGEQQCCCEVQDPLSTLTDTLSDLGMDEGELNQYMVAQGLVDKNSDGTLSANAKTEQFFNQVKQLMSGNTEGVNEVLGRRLQWLVDDGATWEDATKFMFDQGAIKSDANGNLAFNYPKGLTMNHYLCQLMDPEFRASEQAGNEGLGHSVGYVYDRMTANGQDPIEVLNWMLENDLATVEENGAIKGTEKADVFHDQLHNLSDGQYEGIDPTLVNLFSRVGGAKGATDEFMNYMFEEGLMTMSPEGKPVLNEKGLALNHDWVQLLDKEFRASQVTAPDPIDPELAKIFDALLEKGYDPLKAVNYLSEKNLVTVSEAGTMEQTANTDHIAQVLTDFGVVA